MTDGIPEAEFEAVRTAAADAGLHLVGADLAAVAGFLSALRPSLDALTDAASSASGADEHLLSTTFRPEWS